MALTPPVMRVPPMVHDLLTGSPEMVRQSANNTAPDGMIDEKREQYR